MYRVVIFGGTTEGRLLYTYALEHRIPAVVFVATEYGVQCLLQEKQQTETAPFSINMGRLTKEQIQAVLKQECPVFVLDATHPYAVLVTEHIKAACEELKIPCFRVLRQEGETEGIRRAASVAEAVSLLERESGNIFVTTGSKELRQYTALTDYQNRLYVRVLPDVQTIKACTGLGITGRHLTAMQGPFSEELNYAFMKEFHIRWLVTKLSGTLGGFPEKCRAAERAGVSVLAVSRNGTEDGISLEEALQKLEGLQ